jgi:hypothetical protein
MHDQYSSVDPEPPRNCEHASQRQVWRTRSNGSRWRVMQCLHCGTSVRDVLRTEHELRAQEPGEFDEDLWQRGRDQRSQAWDDYRQASADAFAARLRAEDDAWFRAHTAYLGSYQWQRRRRARLAIDRGMCQAQLEGCTDYATEGHHLTYAHHGNEPLFDIVSVCHSCHTEITRMDRERRRG